MKRHTLITISAVTLISLLGSNALAKGVDQKKEDRRISYQYTNTVNADWPAHKAGKGGLIVVGKGKNVRAFSAFGGSKTSGYAYAEVANEYKRIFGDKVNVYMMPIPTAAAFYTPDVAKTWSKDETVTFNGLFEHLSDSVYVVDVYTPLAQHASEPIYSRTDHHWAPLGGYYAAQKLAQVAGVPFKDISNYDTDTVSPYVGTMYQYTKDASVKNAPEDFVYYKPRDVEYTTTYINYKTSGLKVTGEAAPKQDKFFYNFKGTGAYCTFMGGDAKIVKVQTSTRNGRHLMILKDSFGNALPGYLFYSFEEIHVIDCRYFNKNMKKYVKDNNITDIVFANNITHLIPERTSNNLRKYLNQ